MIAQFPSAGVLQPMESLADLPKSVLGMFKQGSDIAGDMEQGFLNKQIGAKAAAGDMKGAANAAFAGGALKTGIDINTWDQNRRKQALDLIMDGAKRADTPAKWSALVRSIESTFGPEMVGEFRSFDHRPNALTALEQAQLKMRGEENARQSQQWKASHDLAVRAADRADQPEISRQLKAAGIDPASPEGRQIIQESIKGQNPLDQAIGGMIRDLVPKPAAPDNPVRPQSFEGGQADPMLIPTQAASPGQDSPTQGSMFSNMAPEQKRRLGEIFLLSPRTKALGEQLIKDTDQDRLQTAAKTEIEKEMTGLVGTIGRLESIGQKFKPEYLQIPDRLSHAWTALSERLGTKKDADLSTEEKQQKARLADYTKFRQNAVNNAALYIKYLSGVAVAEAEFQRISKTLPNAGTGIFDGDSPTEFKAKLDEVVAQSKMAYARAHWLRTQGFKGKPWEAGIAIDDMEDIVRQRGAQIWQELQKRGLPPDKMKIESQRQLKREFGI